jgi:hypothetical protein
MTFLVVFFTILWFIRFVKQHFKSWENLGPIGSNSLSTGSLIFLFIIVDRTLDFEIWVLPGAVFSQCPFLKQLRQARNTKSRIHCFCILSIQLQNISKKRPFFAIFLCENMMKYESLTLSVPLMEICLRQPLAYSSDSE